MAVEYPTPGIYFGMYEARYHATGALGSSSMKQLAYSPADYWFHSPHNLVETEKEETTAQLLGTAYHKIVLEGLAAFEARYGCAYENGTTKVGRAESEAIAEAGKIRIKFADWQKILLAGAAIKANEHLASAFQGGPTEVSIFWNHDVEGADPIPMKARIDCLKMRSNTDLKTISPMDGMEFDAACLRQMGTYRYDVQAEHYKAARLMLPKLIADGCVYGDHDAEHLKRVADVGAAFASVFVFLKKSGAPLTYGTMISPGNPIEQNARATIERSIANYVKCREQFGMDTAWIISKPLSELPLEEISPYAFKY